jgi:hypothetical protein
VSLNALAAGTYVLVVAHGTDVQSRSFTVIK